MRVWQLVFLGLVLGVHGFYFELEAKSYKCFSEELPPNFDVYGEYEVAEGRFQSVDFKALDHNGNTIISRSQVSSEGNFNFIVRNAGEHKFCFYNKLDSGQKYEHGLSRRVKFNLFTGTETTDYEGVARQEHLKPIEINLRMMEDIVREIYGEYKYFRTVADTSQKTNQSTHSRVLYLALFGLLFMTVSFVSQTIYLKRFFIAKRVV